MTLLDLSGKTQHIQVSNRASSERISIIVPVLNEAKRLERCLDTLVAQPEEASEILIVDGGSADGTQSIVERYQAQDPRVKFVDATPVDALWTGKAWGLYVGLQRSNPSSEWILCTDADVWASPMLTRSLLAHAERAGVSTFSVATQQHLSGKMEALIHPSMLTTLVYRFGPPGKATRDRRRVQANGQCFLSRRAILFRTDAFRFAQSSLCEDITIARRLADCGEAVGFYEADGLINVRMYNDWREAWYNWPRSLPLRDQYFGWYEAGGLVGVLLFQAMPLPVLLSGAVLSGPRWLLLPAGLLALIRIGVLVGAARAYAHRPWTYWLSPLVDLPVVLRIIQCALRRRHTWRGRTYIRRKGGIIEPAGDPGRVK